MSDEHKQDAAARDLEKDIIDLLNEREISVAAVMAACLMIAVQGANRANLTREKFLELVGAIWIGKEIN